VGCNVRNHEPKATAVSRGIVGRKPEAKIGLDEQKSDTRPAAPGKEAMDSEARYTFGGDGGDGVTGTAPREECRGPAAKSAAWELTGDLMERIVHRDNRNRMGR